VPVTAAELAPVDDGMPAFIPPSIANPPPVPDFLPPTTSRPPLVGA